MVKIALLPDARPPRTTEGVHVLPFPITIDTREQHPWTFTGLTAANRELIVPTKLGTLATGDYSIEGFESQLAIERKSQDDLIGSIGGGHDRFRREHERMLAIVEAGGFCCVIVESSLDRIIAELEDETSGRRMHPETIVGVVASWPQRFQVSWIFAGTRRLAENVALKTMMKFWELRQPKKERRTKAEKTEYLF